MTSLRFLLSISSFCSIYASHVAKLPERHHNFLNSYCLECHDSDTEKGKVNLETLSFSIDTIQKAELWQKALNTLNSGEMPPEEKTQPEANAKTQFLEDLSNTLVLARKNLSDSGQTRTLRRLNFREYKNTIKELLGIEVNVDTLPNDSLTLSGIEGEYDTFGESLFLSSDQIQQYFVTGKKAALETLNTWQKSLEQLPPKQIHRRETEHEARKKISHLLYNYFLKRYKKALIWKAKGSKPDKTKDYGFADVSAAKFALTDYEHHSDYLAQYLAFPKGDQGAWLMVGLNNYHHNETITIPKERPPGKYKLRLRIGANQDVEAIRHFLEMGTAIDKNSFQVQNTFHITSYTNKPQIIETTIQLTENSLREFHFREKRYASSNSEHHKQVYHKALNGVGVEPALWIDWVEWEGPLVNPKDQQHWNNLFECSAPPQQRNDIIKFLSHFTQKAFRGVQPNQNYLSHLMKLYDMARETKTSHLEALSETIAAVLSSPGFLYLNEQTKSKAHQTISDIELASRLSYFLWSAPPDSTLLKIAQTKKLHQPTVLREQAERMLLDDKSYEMTKGFLHQWLHLDRLDFFRFDYKTFPHFDESTREAARSEIFQTFSTLLQNNLDVSNLLNSDFVVINGLLAKHYGIESVDGDHFRKVSLPNDSPRGGLLGMAAIYAMGSNGKETSPVERGAWILRKLLNNPPPPAPANVPQLSRLDDKKISAKQKINLHQEEPQCAQCHRKIDPMGFALENFDAAGQWRTKDGRFNIDPAGQFYKGSSFNNFIEFKKLIHERKRDFIRGFIENLYAYALGRKISFLDEDDLNKLTESSMKNGTLTKDILLEIILHKNFRSK